MELLLKYIEQELMIKPTKKKAPGERGVKKAASKTIDTVGDFPDLDAAYQAYEGCQRCPLCESRNNIVFGAGPHNAQLMLIGEAPGAQEDEDGIPFVGRSGKLLTKMLEAIEINRDEVFISNLVKCRPPKNRNPTAEEIAQCNPLLTAQLKFIRPKIIVTLGAFAAKAILDADEKETISNLRGRIYSYEGIKCIPSFHPAYLLRNPSAKKEAWEDLKLVRKLLDETN